MVWITILLLVALVAVFILFMKTKSDLEKTRATQAATEKERDAFKSGFETTSHDLKNIKNDIEGIKNRYGNIIDVDKALAEKNTELKNLNLKASNLQLEYQLKANELKKEYTEKKDMYDEFLKELSILEESLENISYGLYKPHYSYDTSEAYKIQLEKIREKQSAMLKAENATYCGTKWNIGGSEKEGEKMVKQVSKLMLRAFNGECDAAVAKVSWSNIANMEARIEKAFEAINKLGATNHISVVENYKKLKIEELRLEFEVQEKIYQEKEEQRRIKEQMREEEKALREIEKAQKQAEDDEAKYQKALEKAQSDVAQATGKQLDALNAKILELQNSLQNASEQKQRAISQAQLTKSGHVYVISNIGSFGDNVYKIGMTRRLDPLDRVKELGDASVPFDFDVHAIIYSKDAPALESILHKKFDDKRVNMVNAKREFFRVSIDEIEKITTELKLDIQLTKIAEAKEYRESQSVKEPKAAQAAITEDKLAKFSNFFN
jgi:chromosome segregation ATPase